MESNFSSEKSIIMTILNQPNEENERNIQNPDGTPVYNNRPDELRDDFDQEKEKLEETDVDERQDWGDVDPAGGDAPSSPGSAV